MGQSAIQYTISDAVMGPWTAPSGTQAELLNFVLLQQAILTGKVDAWEPKDPGNPLAGPTSKTPVSKDWPIKGLILTTGNVVSNHAEQKVTIEEMFSEDKLDFICCIDMFMTDTARHADLFLPCTSWFENDDIVGGLHPYVMRMEKAIEPMGESKGDWDIFKLLAQKMGYGEYFQGEANDQIEGILDVLGNLFEDRKEEILKEFRKKELHVFPILIPFPLPMACFTRAPVVPNFIPKEWLPFFRRLCPHCSCLLTRDTIPYLISSRRPKLGSRILSSKNIRWH